MNKTSFKKRTLMTLFLASSILSTIASAKTELTVYTAFESEFLGDFKSSFESKNPEIEIKWVRDSTGVITAKLLAEKDNSHADVIWGVAASSLLVMKNEGMLQPYTPKGFERVDKHYVDSDPTPSWVGLDAWTGIVCVNTVELNKNNLPMPASWDDLTKPIYKGHISMPNPASSGTGFLDVSAWLQMMGDKEGWAYMDKLNQNIKAYSHSGSKPCKDAARGEVTIGISMGYTGAILKTSGAPIEIVVPKEGIGWDSEAIAIVKSTENMDAAKKLVDYAISNDAMILYNKFYTILSVPGISKSVENYPDSIESKMIKNDFEWAANNRERILNTWSQRYDSKSEKK